jgi:hypothetical protein
MEAVWEQERKEVRVVEWSEVKWNCQQCWVQGRFTLECCGAPLCRIQCCEIL